MMRGLYSDWAPSTAAQATISFMRSQPIYADVVLELQAKELKDRLFSYLVPEHLADSVFAGVQVLVPFGQAGILGGYVVAVSINSPDGITAKEILEVVDTEPLFDRDYVDFLNWIAQYYCASLADVVAAAVPSFLTAKIRRKIRIGPGFDENANKQIMADPKVSAIIKILQTSASQSLSTMTLRQRWKKATKGNQGQFYRALGLLRQMMIIERVPERSALPVPKTVKFVVWTGQAVEFERHQRIIDVLARHGGQMSFKSLSQEARTTAATIEKLALSQVVTIAERESVRDPLAHLYGGNGQGKNGHKVLSGDQEQVFAVLSEQLKERLNPVEKDAAPELGAELGREGPWLLHGVTGSGKTEIYLQLIEEALKQRRTAILLVPEIALTPQLANRLTERFDQIVAIWHSGLSVGERYDTWRRIKAGAVKVLLGARSAALVDMPDLGLIILDEEHDSSYKQTSPSPRYHAKEVAIERAHRTGALILLGSATPDVATYYEASQNARVLELPNRIFNQAFPATKIVDMREEFGHGNRSIFSVPLIKSLKECLAKGEQAILLMNRRGYASHVFCRACGYVADCKNCSVALVYHQHFVPAHRSTSSSTRDQLSYLSCHHCGFRCGMLSECPSCASQFIKQYGLGTQRVEAELKAEFPDVKVLRLDSDTAAKRGAHEDILGQFAAGRADVLIGTQMVSKGLDIEGVTLVGILAADAAFNMPDYRSTERGFQLLTQVSGRAGRGSRPGLVVLQTYNAEMPALHWSQSQDYQSLYHAEIAARQAFDYPPFSQLVRLVIAAEDAALAERTGDELAESLGNYLEELMPLSQMSVLGPAPCLIERLRGKYRMHLLIKNKAGKHGHELIMLFLAKKRFADGVVLAVDVDAVDLL